MPGVATQMKNKTIIPARFQTPEIHSSILPRNRLLSDLKEYLQGSAILLLAGPGWGKTVLMQQIARLVSGNVTWLAIEDDDRDVATFVTSFVKSINCHNPNFGKKILQRLSELSSKEVFRKISDEFRQKDQIEIICIDDFHLLDGCTPIEHGMEYLPTHLPSNMASSV
jgi:ATP/maltotriose-dependent transcriptional regulator MalT